MKVDDYVAQQCRILEEAYRQVCHTVGLKQDCQKELYDRRRHGELFQDGDFVMLYSSVVSRGRSKKLHCPWNGPYKVLKKLSEGKRQRLVVHFDHLKPCPSGLRERESKLHHRHQLPCRSHRKHQPPYPIVVCLILYNSMQDIFL